MKWAHPPVTRRRGRQGQASLQLFPLLAGEKALEVFGAFQVLFYPFGVEVISVPFAPPMRPRPSEAEASRSANAGN